MKTLVLHSGGMDSSICLLLARKRCGAENVISLGCNYAQRHSSELEAARTIAAHYGVQRIEMKVPRILGWEVSSLVNTTLPINKEYDMPNSFVPARNGLFLMMVAPYAKMIGATSIYIGVMQRDGACSGYPDCSRYYIDLVERVVREDLQDSTFCIETPLVDMTKLDTLELAASLGELEFLLSHTISCYEGLPLIGCGTCPSCQLRNEGIKKYIENNPRIKGKGVFNFFSPLVSQCF